MKQFEVVTFGSAVKDIMFYSDDVFVIKNKKNVKMPEVLAMEYGAKFPIEDVFVNYGGGAMNTAVGMKNFGVNVAPMINVGRDQVGQEMFSYLKQQKIPTSLINVDKEYKTGFSIILSSARDREHTVFTFKGASNHLQVHSLREFKTKWFYVSSLTNKDWPQEFDKIARQTKRGVKIAWNPGEIQLRNQRTLINFLSSIEVLIMNKSEAIELVSGVKKRISKTQLNNSKYLLKEIQEFGPRKVVITQGAKGVIAIDENQHYFLYPSTSNTKRIVDTVGAGDAFSSGLMSGLVKLNDFDKALQLGIKNSANVLYQIGAQNGLVKVKL